MSTNKKKLYSKEDIRQAQKELKRTEKYFTRNTTRRNTVQIRISRKWHQKIKEVADSEKIMLSFLLDEICKRFFANYQ